MVYHYSSEKEDKEADDRIKMDTHRVSWTMPDGRICRVDRNGNINTVKGVSGVINAPRLQ